jgi:small redox-active disulfide protein 2
MPEDVKMIRVGVNRVGIISLEKVFEELKTQGIQGDDRLKTELIQRVKKRNYIPPTVEDSYAVALVDEYKEFLGMSVERRKHLEIKILGPGCMQCDQLEREVMNVLAELGVPADLEHVRDIARFKEYGVFGTPALLINREVKSVGKVPLKSEIKKWIEAAVK